MNRIISLASLILLVQTTPILAQLASPPLGNGPWVFNSFEEDFIKVSVLGRGMDHPFGMEFMPGTTSETSPLGDILISERYGKVRLFREGHMLEDPIINLMDVFPLMQLFDIELHPDFSTNGLVYFTFIKQLPHPDGSDKLWATTALARGRWIGSQLVDLEEVFEADAWSDNICGASSRMHFLADGTLLFGASHRCDEERPQRLDSDIGKIMRLNDDGTVPRDNPFIAVEGALPEVYAWGIRSVMDFATHPETGEVWELENGPQGGDEVNILRPGANYGWPLATFGRDYDGTRFSPQPWVEGTELPVIFWVPSITVAGMNFYTGDKFANWKGNLFVTSMIMGRVPGTGHLERVVLNEFGELRREQLLNALQQRIRFVIQGPDDLLYLLTDEADGALLRLEPASAEEAAMFSSVGISRQPQDLSGEALVFEGQDCQSCHRTEAALLGPSYRDIAGRYSLTEANVSTLADKVIKGDSGAWGDTPMNPHPTLALDTAKEMIRQILSL